MRDLTTKSNSSKCYEERKDDLKKQKEKEWHIIKMIE